MDAAKLNFASIVLLSIFFVLFWKFSVVGYSQSLFSQRKDRIPRPLSPPPPIALRFFNCAQLSRGTSSALTAIKILNTENKVSRNCLVDLYVI